MLYFSRTFIPVSALLILISMLSFKPHKISSKCTYNTYEIHYTMKKKYELNVT